MASPIQLDVKGSLVSYAAVAENPSAPDDAVTLSRRGGRPRDPFEVAEVRVMTDHCDGVGDCHSGLTGVAETVI